MIDFHQEFEAWASSRRPDLATENRLAASIREAWAGGFYPERANVLIFIRMRRERSAYDLFIEGIRSEDDKIAKFALPIPWVDSNG